jgi:hypothetical protein
LEDRRGASERIYQAGHLARATTWKQKQDRLA